MPDQNSPAGTDDKTLSSTIEPGQDAGATSDANSADSSGADSGKDANGSELDLEAVVRKAAQQESPEAEDSSTDGKGSEDSKPATSEDAEPEGKADKQVADEDLPFHKHPRWQEKLRKEQELTQERDSFKGKAERFDRIDEFMREHELTPQEVTQGFEIMALMKHDPGKALEMLAPQLEKLELATGRKLPEDLRKRVEDGAIDPEAAQEVARTRMELAAERHRLARAEQSVQAGREAEVAARQQEAVKAMRTAVEGWESEVKGRDPDYPHMQSFITDRTRVLMQAAPPKTPDDAVALVKRAYDEVKASMRKVLPRPAVRTVTSDKTSTTATAAPKTTEQLIRAALGQ